MTIQKRALIDLRDVVAVEYECNHCHARYTVPIEATDRYIDGCPNCREPWLSTRSGTSEPPDDQLVRMLLGYLKDARSRKFGAAVRLELAEQAGDAADA